MESNETKLASHKSRKESQQRGEQTNTDPGLREQHYKRLRLHWPMVPCGSEQNPAAHPPSCIATDEVPLRCVRPYRSRLSLRVSLTRPMSMI